IMLPGCAPKEPPVPAVPVASEADLRRERHFGIAIAHQPGVEWRNSGLGIRIIEPGSGQAPQLTDRVKVIYVGRLADGTVFDDSRKRGKPAVFVVSQLITGWAAAMSTMKPGGKAEFYIPPHLGYGGRRAGNIPPNSGLIFEVELIALNP
ncbi:MAG: FKBP-type peptidyl-prolyl cis-trans isomerase, partial [Candidatus Didemnitutus sp.]|nr:FKBP-type peptidyl-prolyl cis-trans isomerase [Candidatus Didemnitutus sp.]